MNTMPRLPIEPRQTLDTRPDRKDSPMRLLKPLFLLLVIVGGLNWLLVGLFKFDLVAAITGNSFGQTNVLSSVVYALVGISAIALLPTLLGWISSDERATNACPSRQPPRTPIDQPRASWRHLMRRFALVAASAA